MAYVPSPPAGTESAPPVLGLNLLSAMKSSSHLLEDLPSPPTVTVGISSSQPSSEDPPPELVSPSASTVPVDLESPPTEVSAQSSPQPSSPLLPTPPSILPALPSYANAVRRNDNVNKLTHHMIRVDETDGESIGLIPEELLNNQIPLWEDFLIGQFPDKAPHIGKVHVIVNKIWPLSDKQHRVDVFVVNETTFKFRIRDKKLRERILRRSIWNIADKPMFMSRYGPNGSIDERPELKSVPIWITLKNIPQALFSWEGISFFASMVGVPTKLHPDTEVCKVFDEAKVYVDVDLTKTLPTSFRFKSVSGIDTNIEYNYPWLPPRCTSCHKWGHFVQVCARPRQLVTKQSAPGNDDTENSVVHRLEPSSSSLLKEPISAPSAGTAPSLIQQSVTPPCKANDHQALQIDDHTKLPPSPGNCGNSTSLSPRRELTTNSDPQEGDWKLSSSGAKKQSTPPLKQDDPITISPSRFAILEDEPVHTDLASSLSFLPSEDPDMDVPLNTLLQKLSHTDSEFEDSLITTRPTNTRATRGNQRGNSSTAAQSSNAHQHGALSTRKSRKRN